MKSFLAACGIEDSFQFAVDYRNTTESRLRLLYQPFAIIGRDLRADVVLDHTEVARRHVYLQVIEGRVFWVDLEGRTGTREAKESQRFGWLEGERTVCIGPYVIRRFIGDSQAIDKLNQGSPPRDTPLIARPSPDVTQSEIALEFLNGPSQSMLKPVHRVLSLIGSASGCKFRLTDSSVSRFHGSLLQTSAGLWIVDLLGQKGITVNDVLVRCSHLVDGDIVRIGRYQIRIRYRPRVQKSAPGFFDLGHTDVLPKLARRSPTSSSLNSTRWPSTSAPSCSGSVDGQESPSPPIEAISMLSKVDLMSSNSMLSVGLPQTELTETVLVPLVNQFGLMQQQMFDQFQQAMAMMVQMFGTMHRDQMEVVRAELDRLRELTDEFHALKKELAQRTHEKAELTGREPQANSARFDQSAAMERNNSATPSSPSELRGNLPGSRIDRAPVPSSQPPLSSPAATSIPDPVLKASSHASRKPGSTIPAADSDRDTVLWLHERILVLQRERESRWHRILKLMPGMSSS